MRTFARIRVEAVDPDSGVVAVRVDEALVRTSLAELCEAAAQPDYELAWRYQELVSQARAILERHAVEDARRAAIRRCPRHEVVNTTEPTCYVGPVAREPYTDENPRSHGWITYCEVCRCGAERPVNANGMHTEIGCWG